MLYVFSPLKPHFSPLLLRELMVIISLMFSSFGNRTSAYSPPFFSLFFPGCAPSFPGYGFYSHFSPETQSKSLPLPPIANNRFIFFLSPVFQQCQRHFLKTRSVSLSLFLFSLSGASHLPFPVLNLPIHPSFFLAQSASPTSPKFLLFLPGFHVVSLLFGDPGACFFPRPQKSELDAFFSFSVRPLIALRPRPPRMKERNRFILFFFSFPEVQNNFLLFPPRLSFPTYFPQYGPISQVALPSLPFLSHPSKRETATL